MQPTSPRAFPISAVLFRASAPLAAYLIADFARAQVIPLGAGHVAVAATAVGAGLLVGALFASPLGRLIDQAFDSPKVYANGSEITTWSRAFNEAANVVFLISIANQAGYLPTALLVPLLGAIHATARAASGHAAYLIDPTAFARKRKRKRSDGFVTIAGWMRELSATRAAEVQATPAAVSPVPSFSSLPVEAPPMATPTVSAPLPVPPPPPIALPRQPDASLISPIRADMRIRSTRVASGSQRALAALVDFSAFVALMFAFSYATPAMAIAIEPFRASLPTELVTSLEGPAVRVAIAAVALTAWMTLSLFMGSSVGKMLVGIRVVTPDGQGQIGRRLLRMALFTVAGVLFPLGIMLFLAFLVAWGTGSRTLHDWLSGTVVVEGRA